MALITCAYCGTLFPGRSNAKYCNQDCYRKARGEGLAEIPRMELKECRFTDGVICEPEGDCSKCGWNPMVAQKRLDGILAGLLGVEVKSDGD